MACHMLGTELHYPLSVVVRNHLLVPNWEKFWFSVKVTERQLALVEHTTSWGSSCGVKVGVWG